MDIKQWAVIFVFINSLIPIIDGAIRYFSDRDFHERTKESVKWARERGEWWL